MPVRLAALAALTLVALLPIADGGAASAARCALWAAPYGDDAAPGSAAQPFRTIAKLTGSLQPGQTGCLPRGSVFAEHVVVTAVGRADAKIRVTSAAGAPATLADGLEWTESAQHVVFDRVVVSSSAATANGSLPATVILRGFANGLVRSDVSAGTVVDLGRSCVLLDHARRALVDRNALHDCARRAGGAAVYGAGVSAAISVNAVITNNVVFDNPGDGIALAPNAQRSTVTRNLVVGNEAGVYFGGGLEAASNDNRVERNIVVRHARFAVHGSTAANAPVGRRNLVTRNCLWQAGQRMQAGTGYRSVANRIVNPRVRKVAGGYVVPEASPCYAYRPAP